jgi:ADP-ribose pyrophosphatase YjhB (NUDIX family)
MSVVSPHGAGERMATAQRPVISLIAIRQTDGSLEVLLQTRNKCDDDTPYHGYFELPQGKIEARENITDAATRELREETGLELNGIRFGQEEVFRVPERTSEIFISRPLICVTDRVQNHIALAIVVKVSGEVSPTREASQHRWVTLDQLRQVFEHDQIFPLNRPMIEEFLRNSSRWLELI